MSKKLWEASEFIKKTSNLSNYEKFIKKNYNYKYYQNYSKLLSWSLKNSKRFWNSIWDYAGVNGIKNEKFKLSKNLIDSKFFINSKLNFSENLLSKKNNNRAITFISENGYKEVRSWRDLNKNTIKIVKFLKSINLKKGQRVAAYMPNTIQTVESFLATSAVGAIWSSCSPDFGVNGVIERFIQIRPSVLIICDRYYYNGKEINVLERLNEIVKKISSIKKVIIVNYPGKKYINLNHIKSNKIHYWKDIPNTKVDKIFFEKFDFDHELAILYSSGTTGKPKCICHRSGGVLLQHLKEHQLHCEIKPNDNVFYFTTCGWMMWNWLVTVLASKASILLFDGFPMYKKPDLLLKIANQEKVSLFGVSAKYIDALRKSDVNIKNKFKLKYLKTICSTGSPLSNDNFEFVYKKIKKNVHLASVSGGTDIVSCFVLGNIFSPVYKGEIQNNGLGMDVDIFNSKGKSLLNKKGELVCKNSFPSQPKKFWNDKKNQKYKKAYFNEFKNIWHHGDYAEKKKTGGYIIYGRSDATLNPGGVRLGTAEIYSVVEGFEKIKESICVGQSWKDDVRIILFVVLKKNYQLSSNLIKSIKVAIRKDASPRHVPAKIIQVEDIPRTKNGKIVELAVKNIIEGISIKNKQALANPEALNLFRRLDELTY
ncbi:MAG: acetoacetate--CoA ligase [Candidatus Pelagibacter sp.]